MIWMEEEYLQGADAVGLVSVILDCQGVLEEQNLKHLFLDHRYVRCGD